VKLRWLYKRLPCSGDLEWHTFRFSVSFVDYPVMKRLSKVKVASTSPTKLLRLGTKLRLCHKRDEILFVKYSLFWFNRVVLRYPISQLTVVRRDWILVARSRWWLIFDFIQFCRNYLVYGFWDGMAATNLQNMNDQRSVTVPVIQIGFIVPDVEYEVQIFTLTERWGNWFRLADCTAYLQSLIFKHRRSRRHRYGF